MPSILHTILLSCLRFFLEAFDAAADDAQAVEHFGSFAFLIRLSCGDRSLHFLAVDASRKEDCVALPDRFVICYVKTGTILRFYAKDIPAPSFLQTAIEKPERIWPRQRFSDEAAEFDAPASYSS